MEHRPVEAAKDIMSSRFAFAIGGGLLVGAALWAGLLMLLL